MNALDPFQLIGYAAETSPTSLAALAVTNPEHPERGLVLKATTRTRPIPPAARQQFVGGNGDGEPPTHFETGRALLVIPADVAKNLRGPVEEQDVIWMMLVKRNVYERMKSGIIVPAGQGRPVLIQPGG